MRGRLGRLLSVLEESEWATWVRMALIASIVASLVSIAVSSIFCALTLFLWILDCRSSGRLKFQIPGFAGFAAAYAAGVIVSILFSPDVLESAINLKKLLLLFSYMFLVTTYLDRSDIRFTLKLMFGVLVLSAGYGVFQQFVLLNVHLMNRITGFMSHWMTFSGQLMLGITAMVAHLVVLVLDRSSGSQGFSRALDVSPGAAGIRQRSTATRFQRIARHLGELEPYIVILMLVPALAALLLTQTRSTWLGTMVAVFLVVTIYGFRSGRYAQVRSKFVPQLRRFRWSGPLVAGLLLLLIFLALPPGYHKRLYAGLDPKDYTTAGRLELFRTGKNMVMDRPLTGIGPRMVPRLYQEYRTSEDFPSNLYQHLHNNFLQVAAESGLPTLLFWLGIWIWAFFDLVRFCRRAGDDRLLFYHSVTALAALAAFLVAGLFEYNFGDSEVLILLIFLLTSAHVLAKQREGSFGRAASTPRWKSGLLPIAPRVARTAEKAGSVGRKRGVAGQ